MEIIRDRVTSILGNLYLDLRGYNDLFHILPMSRISTLLDKAMIFHTELLDAVKKERNEIDDQNTALRLQMAELKKENGKLKEENERLKTRLSDREYCCRTCGRLTREDSNRLREENRGLKEANDFLRKKASKDVENLLAKYTKMLDDIEVIMSRYNESVYYEESDSIAD